MSERANGETFYGREIFEKTTYLTLLCILEFSIVLFECDESCIEKCSFCMRKDNFRDFLVLHIVLEEFFYEFAAGFMIVYISEELTESW